VAKGRRTSLIVRALALVFALALAALAARLWLGSAQRNADSGEEDPRVPPGEIYETAPPQHEPYSEEDEAALRERLRDAPPPERVR
jgi:flagellar basal body-associated protein FliL